MENQSNTREVTKIDEKTKSTLTNHELLNHDTNKLINPSPSEVANANKKFEDSNLLGKISIDSNAHSSAALNDLHGCKPEHGGGKPAGGVDGRPTSGGGGKGVGHGADGPSEGGGRPAAPVELTKPGQQIKM